MRKAVEQILQELEVPRAYIAYPCLLRMAERYEAGEPLGQELLLREAENTGHRYSALRKSLHHIAWAAYSHRNGRRVLGPLPRRELVWSFLEALFAAAKEKKESACDKTPPLS